MNIILIALIVWVLISWIIGFIGLSMMGLKLTMLRDELEDKFKNIAKEK